MDGYSATELHDLGYGFESGWLALNLLIAQDGDDCFLYIGDNNDIREHASIHRSSKPMDQMVKKG